MAATSAKSVSRVVVSTDDEEIALFAERFGAEVVIRPPKLADDKTTLDPVIVDAVQQMERRDCVSFDYILTVQPTSPLVKAADVDAALHLLSESGADTVLTVVDDRHLCWTRDNGKPTPVYKERVNRQQLPENYKETGAIIGCTRRQLLLGTRIGAQVELYEIPFEYSFDIDSFADLYVCEAMLSRRRLVFAVVGYPEVGMGHAYRAVMLAHELVDYEIIFVCDNRSRLAYEYIKSNNYPALLCVDEDLAETVVNQKPDLVINDILDTERDYIEKIKKKDIKVINFEDLGAGIEYCDLVINALYPAFNNHDNVLAGPSYFCLRDEFLYTQSDAPRDDKLKNVLITFGGVDDENITQSCIDEIADICIERKIDIEVVLGPGYKWHDQLKKSLADLPMLNCNVVSKTKRISDHMMKADIAFTSGGRTVFELASLCVPTIVICQNERETTHTFAAEGNGILNLGEKSRLRSGAIRAHFIDLIDNESRRGEMREKMKKLDLRSGKDRVVEEIRNLMKQEVRHAR